MKETTQKCELAHERLKEALYYNPQTGCFHWKISPTNRVKVGSKAGRFDTKGYIRIGFDGSRYSAHRLAFFYMNGRWPSMQIDHINGIKHDNAWSNLREADSSQNQWNQPKRKNNTSGHKGVCFDKCKGKWKASIASNGVSKHLGNFSTKELASEAYEQAAARLHGEFRHV